jgi:5-methylcytosine-specific restriction protein A
VDQIDNIETYATLPLKPCRRAGCPELVCGGGYCAKHRKDARRIKSTIQGERGESGEWHGLYYTVRWREMRAAQLIREPYCRDCGTHGVRSMATDVDHIVPHRGNRTLFYDETNLQSLCHACHSRKTMAEQQSYKTPPLP